MVKNIDSDTVSEYEMSSDSFQLTLKPDSQDKEWALRIKDYIFLSFKSFVQGNIVLRYDITIVKVNSPR